MVKRVMIVAGEASGDLHGSGVVRELKTRLAGLDVFGIGGDAMKREGMEVIFHISSLSFMGFLEVARNLPAVLRIERDLEGLLETRKPDVLVLIDFPGLNLRLARRAKRHKIPVLYYISPQVWAWNRGRVRKMRHLVDKMKVVFPFEVDIYRSQGIDVEFVGHPIVERIGSTCGREEFFARHGLDPDKKLLGLFPGSRVQEIDRILPVMVSVARRLRAGLGINIAVSVAPNLGPEPLRAHLRGADDVILVERGTYDLMNHADAAVVTSGTATLEAGWFCTPMAVVYKTSPMTFFIGRLLVDVPYIGLVNIVAGKKIVPEFVQHGLTRERLMTAVARMLSDAPYAATLRTELGIIRKKLGGPGASGRVADGVMALAEGA